MVRGLLATGLGVCHRRGVAVTHCRHGLYPRVNHNEHVKIEGMSKDQISITVDLKATSKVLASAIEMSLDRNELVMDV